MNFSGKILATFTWTKMFNSKYFDAKISGGWELGYLGDVDGDQRSILCRPTPLAAHVKSETIFVDFLKKFSLWPVTKESPKFGSTKCRWSHYKKTKKLLKTKLLEKVK